ncbi:MAG: type II secretion system protein N [Nitrospirota bacterium]
MKIYSLDHLLQNTRLISLINASIGLLFIIAILFLVRDVVSISFSPEEKVIKPGGKAQDVIKHELQDYAVILKDNPFGFAAGELKPISSASTAISNVVDVSLIGTVSGPRSLSYAIFMDKTGKQEVFRIGNSIFGLGILKKVEKERVFINVGGKNTEIPLSDITTIKEVKGSETTSQAFARKTGESTYTIDQRRVQHAIENPNQIMTDARLLPNIVEGRQEGFVLREVKPGGIYQSLGLQNGDVLLRINEYNISNPETALQALTALKGMDRVQLDIIRNGAKMTMTYQIR